jgi:hypothetical protein
VDLGLRHGRQTPIQLGFRRSPFYAPLNHHRLRPQNVRGIISGAATSVKCQGEKKSFAAEPFS